LRTFATLNLKRERIAFGTRREQWQSRAGLKIQKCGSANFSIGVLDLQIETCAVISFAFLRSGEGKRVASPLEFQFRTRRLSFIAQLP
jgi:hypothetical protein